MWTAESRALVGDCGAGQALSDEQYALLVPLIPPAGRAPPRCGAYHWARELIKLGHEVRLMPPQYVRLYVKTNKHDAADAEAICEAVTRPGIRFVPVKTVEQ